jgi:hypothetical protein
MDPNELPELIKRMRFHGWNFINGRFYLAYEGEMTVAQAEEYINKIGGI